jgi:inorganic pyrophosphatase
MDDEAGGDAKILAVPLDRVLPIYKHWTRPEDLQPERLMQIQHFFEHYKDLEPGKWVKVSGWLGPDAAREEIMAGVARYQSAGRKPMF